MSSTVVSHKVTGSATSGNQMKRRFGDNDVRLPALDSFVGVADYDERLAYLMSMISAWAYADEKVLADKLRYHGVEGAQVRRIAVQNNALLVTTTAYLIQSQRGSVGVLAFRGTDPANLITILADAQVMQRPFGGGVVHAGFYANIQVVWDEITELLEHALEGSYLDSQGEVRKLERPLETLYITGHSLGGALAVLAAQRLCGDGYEMWDPKRLLRGVYTFGQPMVGNQGFVESCENNFGSVLFRHVYRNDVVPHLPPRSEMDYRHIGGERRAAGVAQDWGENREASVRANLALALAEVAMNVVEVRFATNHRLGGYSIDDHMPSNYLDVSRGALDPASVGAAPARRSWVPAVAEATIHAIKAPVDTLTRLLRPKNAQLRSLWRRA